MGKVINLFRKGLGIHRILDRVSSSSETIEQRLDRNYKLGQELLSAMKFNSTIADSKWFVNKSISPGDSAVNYAFFYTLYRVLSSIKPNNILEFGLGQSSKMVHQYAQFFDKKAITVEHDKDWVDFFLNGREGDYPVNIQMLDLEQIEYKGERALVYKDCKKAFTDQKFDLVIVDGPFGFTPDTVYSRLQILDIVQECIADDFVIIMDDFDRKGEKNTVQEIFDCFARNNIGIVSREYVSVKNHILITTPRFHFLTTL